MALNRERVEKIILIVVIVCVGAVCAWIFYLGPRVKTIAGGRKKIRELEERYSEAQSTIKRAKGSKDALENLKRRIAQLDKDIPPEAMDEWILNRVNITCSELNVRYEHLYPQETEDFEDEVMAQSYRRKKVKLAMVCDYHTLGRFLNRLENASPFIIIDDVVVRESGVPDRQEVQFSINYVARKE